MVQDGLTDVGAGLSAIPVPAAPHLIQVCSDKLLLLLGLFSESSCQPGSCLQARIVKGGVIDVFGQLIPPVSDDRVQCPVCESSVAAGRYGVISHQLLLISAAAAHSSSAAATR